MLISVPAAAAAPRHPHGTSGIPTGLGQCAATAIVDLARLDSAEVEAMVRSAAHDKDLPDEVFRQIVQRSEGVALFVEEVTREVIESGMLVEHEHSWELIGPLPTGLVPASLDASIAARLDRLGEARATAQLAATIGREFPYALLRAVSDRSEAKLGDDLQRIVDSGLASQILRRGRRDIRLQACPGAGGRLQVPAARRAAASSRAHRERAPVRLQGRGRAPSGSRGAPPFGRRPLCRSQRLLAGRRLERTSAHGNSRSPCPLCPCARGPQAPRSVARGPGKGTRPADCDCADTHDREWLGLADGRRGVQTGPRPRHRTQSSRQDVPADLGHLDEPLPARRDGRGGGRGEGRARNGRSERASR